MSHHTCETGGELGPFAQPRALFFRFLTDRNVFDICLLNHGWSASAFCKRISYFTMFLEIVHDFLVSFDTSLIEQCLVTPSAKYQAAVSTLLQIVG